MAAGTSAYGPFSGLMNLATAPAPAAVMPATSWFGGPSNLIATQQPSSTAGVPQNVTTAVPGTGSVGNVVRWGVAKATGSVWSNPAFLAIVALALSTIMLAHVAHIQIA
jgi:hypothetical protein